MLFAPEVCFLHTQVAKNEGRPLHFYVRLILIIVDLQIINRVQSLMPKHMYEGGILSYRKACQTMKNNFQGVLPVLRSSADIAIKQSGDIYRMPSKNHGREKRKKRVNFVEDIFLFV